MGTDTAVGAGLDVEPSTMLPGIAAVAIWRRLPAPTLDFDRVLVGLHLGSAGWMEWHMAEQDARRLPVPPGSLSLVPAGISYWWRRDQPSELVLVELKPSFVASVARNTDAPVLRAMPVFQDRAIAHILSALREEIPNGCRSRHRYGTALCTALADPSAAPVCGRLGPLPGSRSQGWPAAVPPASRPRPYRTPSR